MKRFLALAGVVLLVGLYIATLVFAIIGNGMFVKMFFVSLAMTVVIPLIIHIGLSANNVKEGLSPWTVSPYKYKRKDTYGKKDDDV